MKKVNVSVEMTPQLHDKLEAVCQDLGLDVNTAFNIFARKMVNEQSIPFEVTENEMPDEKKLRREKVLRAVGWIAGIVALTGLVGSIVHLLEVLKGKD